jgi:hypothetical protein
LVVAYPANAELIAATVAAAVRHGIPITAGKGTGNYGQAIPGWQVARARHVAARAIAEVGDGFHHGRGRRIMPLVLEQPTRLDSRY